MRCNVRIGKAGKGFILTMVFILLCCGCGGDAASALEVSSEEDTGEILIAPVEESQTDASQEEREGFSLRYDGNDTGIWIPFLDCVCEYDANEIQVYSCYIQNGYQQGISLPDFRYALYIQTPEDTMQIYPVKDFLVDEEAGSLYMVWEEGTFERVQGINFVKNQDYLGGYKMVSTSLLEEWIGNAYGLTMDITEKNFTDLHADLEEIGAENEERILKGTASGIYKNTGKEYYIDWEINRTTGEERIWTKESLPENHFACQITEHTLPENAFLDGYEKGTATELPYFCHYRTGFTVKIF